MSPRLSPRPSPRVDPGLELRVTAAPAQLPAPVPPRRPKPVHPRPARTPLPVVHTVAIAALLTLSGLAVWGLLYTYVLSSVQEHRTQHELRNTLLGQLADGTAPIEGDIAPGSPVATLQIPRLGLRKLIVVEGTSSGDLEAGPGHRRDTPLPGKAGASFVLGRSRTFGGPFAQLGRLRKGDRINVETGEGVFTFSVEAVRRPGAPLTVLDPGAARLTLVASEAIKRGARQAIYVDASLEDGKPQPASTGRPTSLPLAERQMSGDRGALVLIVLWLQGLVVVLIAGTWARARWGLRPTLLVGVPVLLAAVWGVTEAMTGLLPNLF